MNEVRRGFGTEAGLRMPSSNEVDYDIGELGPAINLDETDLPLSPTEGTEEYSDRLNFNYFDELRTYPEYLDDKMPYRRRRRVHLVLQKINGSPVLLSKRRFDEAQRLSEGSLFADQVAKDKEWTNHLFSQSGDVAERFSRPEIGQKGGLRWTANSRELSFLVHHLSEADQTELAKAYRRGERINLNFLYGPRWKITRFGDQTKAYEWPRDDSIDDPKDFRGSNFVIFTKVGLNHDESGGLVLDETLLAEANLFTKTGSTRSYPKGGPGGGIFFDRSLEGLKRRALEGDIYLSEAERLYNQSANLDEAELSRSEEQWVRNAFIDFLSGKVDRHGYSVKGAMSMRFTLDKEGNVITVGDDVVQEVKFAPMRVNAKRGGYLEGVLKRIGEQSHAFNRLHKYTRFQEEIYPVFRDAVERTMVKEALRAAQEESSTNSSEQGGKLRWQSDARQILARQLTRTDAMLKRFVARSPRNLAYMLNAFINDHTFDADYEPGIGRAVRVLQAIGDINRSRIGTERYRAHFNQDYMQDCLDQIEVMQRTDWLSQETRSGLVLPISVGEPMKGANHRRISSGCGKNGHVGGGQLFSKRRNGNGNATTPHAPETRDGLVGFDIYPAKMTVAEVREQLARYGVDIISAIVSEGNKPAIYAMYMDSKPRQMFDGSWISPAQWVNMLRRVFDSTRYTNGRSSKVAIEAGFAATAELAKTLARQKPELENLLQYFDYQARSEATKEAKAHSGLAGEVFTRIALNADLATVLGIEVLPEEIDYKITYIDRDRDHGKGKLSAYERENLNRYLTELNAEGKAKSSAESGTENPESSTEHSESSKTIRPDFVVQMTDKHTGEVVELLIDSKAYIKKITPVAITNLYDHYKAALNNHRILVVVAHSPVRRITREAQEVARGLGVMIVGSDAIASALAKADTTHLDNPHMGDLVQEYWQFQEHPSVYSEDSEKRVGIKNYEQLLDLENASLGLLFSSLGESTSGREKLVYAE